MGSGGHRQPRKVFIQHHYTLSETVVTAVRISLEDKCDKTPVSYTGPLPHPPLLTAPPETKGWGASIDFRPLSPGTPRELRTLPTRPTFPFETNSTRSEGVGRDTTDGTPPNGSESNESRLNTTHPIPLRFYWNGVGSPLFRVETARSTRPPPRFGSVSGCPSTTARSAVVVACRADLRSLSTRNTPDRNPTGRLTPPLDDTPPDPSVRLSDRY